jgi:hypothetical protein
VEAWKGGTASESGLARKQDGKGARSPIFGSSILGPTHVQPPQLMFCRHRGFTISWSLSSLCDWPCWMPSLPEDPCSTKAVWELDSPNGTVCLIEQTEGLQL